jgi:NhaP-type Na+/H+ or K+/H+ antiporter
MRNPALWQGALSLAAGMTSQALAERVRIPSIVVLLLAGTALGPDGAGILDPAALGAGRADLVSLAVIVILFEGGLGLDLSRLRQQQRSLLLLLTLGAVFSFAGGTLATRALVGLPWSIAAMYGALMIVTGPTVVTPLLSRLRVDRRAREILVSEGVLIDPLGAVVALVAAEFALGQTALLGSARLVAFRLSVGAALGVAGGLALSLSLRRRLLPEHLASPAALAMALLVASLANALSAEAGLMAAVAAGVTLGNAGVRDLGRLREFKETLTLVLLSFVFVVLAADLRVAEVFALGLPGLGVVAALIWVARPLSVFACTLGSALSVRERLFMAWICPRGVVAVAVAGLFRILLDEAGIPGGAELQALVFVTVVVTVTLQGLTAKRVAERLGLDFPNLRETIVVGADRLGRLLAHLLVREGREVLLVDRSPWFLAAAEREGLPVREADALSADALEAAGAARADTLVAITRNPALNALVLQRVRENFRVERLLAWTAEREGGDAASAALRPFPGRFPGVDEANAALGRDQLVVVEYEVPQGEGVGLRVAALPFAEGEFALLVRRGEAVVVATPEHELRKGDRLWCARPEAARSRLEGLLTRLGSSSAPAAAPR